ncbi:hypothetical protein BB558_006445 [Smittium angustum]|uniref:RNA helicase n=1 Tax=Smittium angustum TaxID=133377 RepID=A0A2U1IXQ7_SMIAN|nr:hypothetical protein BB558_006445 [Smittium angustum]
MDVSSRFNNQELEHNDKQKSKTLSRDERKSQIDRSRNQSRSRERRSSDQYRSHRTSDRHRSRSRSKSRDNLRSRNRDQGRDRDHYRNRDRSGDRYRRRSRSYERNSERRDDKSKSRYKRGEYGDNRAKETKEKLHESSDSEKESSNSKSLENNLDLNGNKNEKSRPKVPLSVEDLQKIKKSKEELQKPVFLSKEERQRIALEKRQKQVEEQKSIQQAELKKTQEIVKIFNKKDESRYRSRHRRRSSSDSNGSRSQSRDRSRKAILEEKQKEMEMKAIRERYIGGEKPKRRARKVNNKSFVFDWDAKDDTSQDYNVLYSQRYEPQFFGRGHIAGFDVKEQMAKKSQFYQNLLSERRTQEEVDRARELVTISQKKEARVQWDDRHWSEKKLAEMKERDWRIFKEDFNISCKGGGIPNPIRAWDESGLPENILKTIRKVGYEQPTPIQRQAIPIGLQNRDIIGIAETGSGKTASFLIPMLVYILSLPKLDETNMNDGPYAVILAPTRELAQQIEQEALKFANHLGFKCVSIVGGHSIEEQSFALRNGAEIIIATPGRLKDCIDRRILVLNQTTYVVMDEADRMIDMGFEEDVNFILDALPVSQIKPDTQDAEDASKMLQSHSGSVLRYRQTTMFSATMPPLVERLAKKYLRRPAIVTIGTAGQAVDTVVQKVEFINNVERKRSRLIELLSEDYVPPIIVFVNLKKTADSLLKLVSKSGYSAVVLHGGRSQEQRELALAKLKNGDADLLVATDVAGRGIDVKDVSLVINFDMAKSIEDYTHRIGRTGRAGKEGVAITFLSNDDTEVIYDLRKMIEKSPISKCPIELLQHEASQAPPGLVRSKRKYEETLFKE